MRPKTSTSALLEGCAFAMFTNKGTHQSKQAKGGTIDSLVTNESRQELGGELSLIVTAVT